MMQPKLKEELSRRSSLSNRERRASFLKWFTASVVGWSLVAIVAEHMANRESLLNHTLDLASLCILSLICLAGSAVSYVRLRDWQQVRPFHTGS